jgi:hypothetical protein
MRVIKDMVLLEGLRDRIGRTYPRSDLECQVRGKRFYGEFGIAHGLDISMANSSHVLENLTIDGDDLVGDMTVLDTPSGKMVESMLDNGARLQTSIRATGRLDDRLEVSELTLITFDLVREDNDERF